MRVLVACEFSGKVRDAFSRRGHDAWSCDFTPSMTEGNHHLGDVRDILMEHWDMVIAHPPCTYLTKAGNDAFKRDPSRWEKLEEGAKFFRMFLELPVPRLCVENPVILNRAKEIIGSEPTQIVSPHMFGHFYSKRTCLWLRDLTPLVPTQLVEPLWSLGGMKGLMDHVAQIHPVTGKSLSRSDQRSITPLGLAEAMADQWGGL